MLNTQGLHPTLAAVLQDAFRLPCAAQPDYSAHNDAQLLGEAKRLARRVSFFNAAEGNWSAEAEARSAANSAFRACRAELERRGIEFVNEGGCLL